MSAAEAKLLLDTILFFYFSAALGAFLGAAVFEFFVARYATMYRCLALALFAMLVRSYL